jgi:hypothetical protein
VTVLGYKNGYRGCYPEELMSPPQGADRYRGVEQFYGVLRNLNELEQREIRKIVMAVLNPSLRERYLTLNYHRAAINVELLLTLRDTKQFQAIALLARSVFELAVEVKLISQNSDAGEKIDALTRIEKLKYSKRIVVFKKSHPDAMVATKSHEAFIAANERPIMAEQAAIWPGVKNVTHWMNRKLPRRVELLGDPFHKMYEIHYAPLSWYSHAGVVGVNDPSTDLFAFFAGIACTIAGDSYIELLKVIVSEFKLGRADPKLVDKITCSKLVAFADSQEEADVILRAHGLERQGAGV